MKIQEVQWKIIKKLREQDKISLFIEIRRGNKMSIMAFIKQMGFNANHTGRFNKIAVVTDIDWQQISLTLKDFLMPADIKTFVTMTA